MENILDDWISKNHQNFNIDENETKRDEQKLDEIIEYQQKEMDELNKIIKQLEVSSTVERKDSTTGKYLFSSQEIGMNTVNIPTEDKERAKNRIQRDEKILQQEQGEVKK